MEFNREIVDGMHELQAEMHEFISQLSKANPTLNYDTCFTIYTLNKLSHLQQQIDDIKSFLSI